MGSFLSVPILALAAALQATIVPQFTVFGGRPDLVFLFVAAWALNTTLEEGVVWAFVGGIMKDLLSLNPLGTSIFGLILLVFGLSVVRQQMYRIGVLSLVWIVLLGTLLQQITTLAILLLTGFQPAPASRSMLLRLAQEIGYVIPPTMIYNLVVIFPVYWFVRRIQNRVTQDKRMFR